MWNVTELHWCSYVEIQSQSGAIVLAGSGSVLQLVSRKVAEQRSLFINSEPTRKHVKEWSISMNVNIVSRCNQCSMQ